MTEKTLGQVLYEAELQERGTVRVPFAALHVNQERYERIAQAVAAVLREQIAVWIELQRNDIPATGAEFAAAIRSMKP